MNLIIIINIFYFKLKLYDLYLYFSLQLCNKNIKIIFLFVLGRDLNVLIYIRRRIAMCCRKLRKLKEAVKMFRDVS